MRKPDVPTVQQLRRSKKWIVWGGLPWPDVQWCGPYKTRSEASQYVRNIKRAIANTKELS